MKESIKKWTFCTGLLTISLIIFLSLISFTKADSALFTSSPNDPVKNLIGLGGVYIAGGLLFLFGTSAYLFVLSFIFSALKRLNILVFKSVAQSFFTKAISFLIILCSSASLLALFGNTSSRFAHGGFIGFTSSTFLLTYMGKTGAFIVSSFILTIGVVLLWTELIINIYRGIILFIKARFESLKEMSKRPAVIKPVAPKASLTKEARPQKVISPVQEPKVVPATFTKTEPEKASFKEKININIKKQPKLQRPKEFKATTVKIQDYSYTLPTPSILSDLPPFNEEDSKKNIEAKANLLESTLETFGVSAKVVNADQGPTITRYELDLAPGVKINRISNLADDIAMALCAAQVRIVAPIPGKGTVGVELPNDIKKIVFLRECVEQDSFSKKKSPTAISIGQDVAGNPLVADIREMPHLLIAGSTGAGKTVCINTLLCSLLFKSSPWELKLILVDPKMVEMTQYADIPHLFTPIVSDAKKAASVLVWAVEEMERRYKVLAEASARNIATFNEKKPKEERMPYIVIVVDELADLMMVARDQIETAIARIAQLARAVGIHLVLATQRPSADIITGVIKNNLPARISFKVPTQIDSRVILDHTGAEKLLGKGDMLYLGPGLHKPIRAQACFMKDEDIDTVVEFIKDQNIPVMYNRKIEEAQKRSEGGVAGERDDVLDDAIKIVLESGQASASILQRRMRVGYNRAARLIDQMEAEGVVGPFQGSKPRNILVDPISYFQSKEEAETQT